MTTERIVWYVADPMCSWCWGFSSVIDAIGNTYRDRLTVNVLMGGLRTGTKKPMTPEEREDVLDHWRDVHQRTGQAFTFEGAMPEGFVYDTEPPSRAVVSMSALKPEAGLSFLERVQAAFYLDGQNVTQRRVLANLAVEWGIEAELFLQVFDSPEANTRTREEFLQVYRWGVRGFPTVLLQHRDDLSVLTYGYRPFADVQPALEAWLRTPDTRET